MDSILAVDFGGTKVETALVTTTGSVIASSRFRKPTGREQSRDEIAAGLTEILQQTLASSPQRPIGCGIGVAGPLDIHRGVVSPFNIPQWQDYPLQQLVEDVTGLPVTMRLDGQAIALAEHWVGAGQGTTNMMGMIVSTGVGGGVIVNGQLVTGASGNAGHIGHMLFPPDTGDSGGDPDFPTVTALEATASGPFTVAWAKRQGWKGSTGEDLARSLAEGDPIAQAAVRRAGHAIGKVIASATALLELELIVIAGGFSKVGPELFTAIREPVDAHHLDFVRSVRIEPSQLTDDAPLIGAAGLVARQS